MAIVHAPNPRLIVDTEAERSTGWPDGIEVFCKDTGKYYQLSGGAWVLKGASVDALNTLVQAAITSGDIAIVLNGKQLAIAVDGTVSAVDA